MTTVRNGTSCATRGRPVLRCSFRRLGGCHRGPAASSSRLSRTKGKTMYHDFNYEATLASSLRAPWQLDDVLRRRPGAGLHAAISCRKAWRGRRALAEPQRFRAADSQPDRRAPISVHVRDRRGVHPPVPRRPCAARAARRRLARPRAAQLRQRGSQAHPFVQALPRGVRARLPGRVPDDRPVGSDRRRDPAPRAACGRRSSS